jgi:hypothetical protein
VLATGILAYIACLFGGEDNWRYVVASTGVSFAVVSSLFLDDLINTMTKMMLDEQ